MEHAKESDTIPSLSTNDLNVDSNPSHNTASGNDGGHTLLGIGMPSLDNLSEILEVSDIDGQLCYESIDSCVPKDLSVETARLSESALCNARCMNLLISNALFREEFIRCHKVAAMLEQNIRRESEEEIRRLKREVAEMNLQVASMVDNNNILKGKVLAANEAKMKAEADLENSTAIFFNESEGFKNSLAEANRMLEASNADNFRLQADLDRLKKAIPSIFKKAIDSDAVRGPFQRLLEATMKVGSYDMINALSAHVTIPNPLPDEVEQMVDDECSAKQAAGVVEMKEVTVPFIEEIGRGSHLSVDEILAMGP